SFSGSDVGVAQAVFRAWTNPVRFPLRSGGFRTSLKMGLRAWTHVRSRCELPQPGAKLASGVLVVLSVWLVSLPAMAQTPACSREAFESAVSQSAAALRDLTGQNRPLFQSRLRALKEKRGWDHDQFLREAAPIVQDERTDSFDR